MKWLEHTMKWHSNMRGVINCCSIRTQQRVAPSEERMDMRSEWTWFTLLAGPARITDAVCMPVLFLACSCQLPMAAARSYIYWFTMNAAPAGVADTIGKPAPFPPFSDYDIFPMTVARICDDHKKSSGCMRLIASAWWFNIHYENPINRDAVAR